MPVIPNLYVKMGTIATCNKITCRHAFNTKLVKYLCKRLAMYMWCAIDNVASYMHIASYLGMRQFCQSNF